MTTERTNQYRTKVLEQAREPVLDVPNLALLAYRSPRQMIQDFEESWGCRPAAVVLPLNSPDGVNIDNPCNLRMSQMVPRQIDLRGLMPADSDPLPNLDLANVVHAFGQLGCDIYLLIEPGFNFVDASPLLIVDSVGDSSRQMCVTTEASQSFLSEVIAEGVMKTLRSLRNVPGPHVPRLRGVVFDIVSIWPMSATDGRIELTCFCAYCVPRLEDFMRQESNGAFDPPDLLGHFRDYPSPANLLLMDRQTGIAYVERVMSTMTKKQVVGLCKMKGFHDGTWSGKAEFEMEAAAEYLLMYMRARHRLTVETVQTVFDAARSILEEEWPSEAPSALDLVLLAEGDAYNWTGGIFLDWLDNWAADFERPPCDELWIDQTSVTPLVKNIRTRYYMWRRSRYYIDALFDAIASASSDSLRAVTGWSRYSDSDLILLLDGRKRSTLAARTEGLANLRTLSSEPNRAGFVAAGMNESALARIINKVQIAKGQQQAIPL